MPGDYTRLSFDPRRDHAGVLMQQGRVQLDADWNEQVELADRRIRAETIDIIGRCVVPRETPDGFLIKVVGGELTIGAGRLYADGLLAENRGLPPLEYDATLGEQRGTLPTPYAQQPYFPTAATTEPLPKDGRHLAYIDVWRREVSGLEEPELVEKAVAVDTTTRLQTVWQVRLLRDVPSRVNCSSPPQDIPGWTDLTRPSGARLTTKGIGVPASDDPCVIPPDGGYRGTENRLYRVEIHDGGAQGVATFKWSRDNASIGSAVLAIAVNADGRSELTVARIGRDAVLRFNAGDWVEVLDDERELARQPGEMRKVRSVDEVRQVLTLEGAALPASAFDPTHAERHTRVRRWDQRGIVRDPTNTPIADVDASNGVIPVPAAGVAVVLENGVEINFDTANGAPYRVGDYWVFAARTADGSVEELDAAPPRGILHHYCILAVVTFPEPTEDCRVMWPPEFGGGGCDCTVCVTAESHNSGSLTIQRAIDEARPSGGKVCLAPGIYNLGDQPVRLEGVRSLRLVGKGWRTVLVYRGVGPAVLVQSSFDVAVMDLTVLASRPAAVDQPEPSVIGRRGRAAAAAAVVPLVAGIGLRNCVGVDIERCIVVAAQVRLDAKVLRVLSQAAPQDAQPLLRVLAATLSSALESAGPAIVLAGVLAKANLRENVLLGVSGIQAVADAPARADGVPSDGPGTINPFVRLRSAALFVNVQTGYLLTAGLRIGDNLMACLLNGIALEGFSIHVSDTMLSGNSILGCFRVGISMLGMVPSASRLSTAERLPTVAAALLRSRLDIRGNVVQTLGDGIVIGTDETRVADNDVGTVPVAGDRLDNLSTAARAAATGQMVTLADAVAARGSGHGIVLVTGLDPDGIDRCQVVSNRVTRVRANGISVLGLVRSAMIKRNIIDGAGQGGIIMDPKGRAETLTVENNQLLDIAPAVNARESLPAGIRLTTVAQAEIASNTIFGVGRTAVQSLGRIGIHVVAPIASSIRIAANDISDVGPFDRSGESQPFVGTGSGIVVSGTFDRADIVDNTVRRSRSKGAADPSAWFAVIVAGVNSDVPSVGVVAAPAAGKVRASAFLTANIVELIGAHRPDELIVLLPDRIMRLPRGREIVGVRGNLLDAVGDAPVVAVLGDGTVVLSDNRCLLSALREPPAAVVRGGAIIASSNYVQGVAQATSLDLQLAAEAPFTVLGNIVSGPIMVNGQPLSGPWPALNVQAF